MKRKILSFIAIIFSVGLLIIAFTACDNNNDADKDNVNNPPVHTCLYNLEVLEDRYKASDASCDKKASYFYSCICGEQGTDTFEYGNVLGHSFSIYIYNNDATCVKNGTETSTCDRCLVQDVRDRFNTKLEHNYSENWIANGSHHWHECSCGDKIDLSEHNFNKNYSCVICGKSISNIAIASFDISKNTDNSLIEYVVQSLDFSYNVYLVGEGEMKDYNSPTAPLCKNNYANKIKNIFIDERILSIGSNAFYGCKNLKDIAIPENILKIGEGAFKNCSSLTSITVPNSVLKIGVAAFNGCYSLKSMTLPFVGSSLYSTSDSSPLFGYIFGTEYFPQSSESLQVAQDGKHYYLPWSLKTVHITGGRVGRQAFRSCQFNTIILSDDVTYIGEMAFFNCPWLESFAIPQGIKTIEADTFNGCNKLTNITIPNSLESIGPRAFKGCGFKNIVIPESIKVIGDEAFSYCWHLVDIVIPKEIAEISDYAFTDCRALEHVFYKGIESDWQKSIGTTGIRILGDYRKEIIYFYSEQRPTIINNYWGNYWHYDNKGQIVVWDYV